MVINSYMYFNSIQTFVAVQVHHGYIGLIRNVLFCVALATDTHHIKPPYTVASPIVLIFPVWIPIIAGVVGGILLLLLIIIVIICLIKKNQSPKVPNVLANA